MIRGLTLGDQTTIGPFSIRPIGGPPTTLRFQIPSGSGGLRFTEMPDPEVEVIVGENSGPHALLLPAGWLVEGLQQSRMVLEDVLFAPGSSEAVDVVCVEQGRWTGDRSGRATERAPLRVLASASRRGEPSVAQQRAWQEVRAYEARTGCRPTGSLPEIMDEDIARDARLRELAARVELLEVPDGCIGYVLDADSRILAIEIVNDSAALQQVLRTTLRSLVFDRPEGPAASAPSSVVRRLLADTSAALAEGHRSSGNAQLAYLEVGSMHGNVLRGPLGELVHMLLLDADAYSLGA